MLLSSFCSLCFFPGHRGLLSLSLLPGASQNTVISSRGEKKRTKAMVAFGRHGRQSGSGANCWRCFGARITRWTSSCSVSRTAGTSTSSLRPCLVSTFEPHLSEWPPPRSAPVLPSSAHPEGPSAAHTLPRSPPRVGALCQRGSEEEHPYVRNALV